ncbi:MAG: RNA 3'-terminal phosphate cyclase [Halothiobacillaceae bacterium]|nr:MAG: RNA 3'-terminal phosphate cyclase [Halothiobacillaceae bacterium]
MLHIDGSQGEGGGQILRSALSMAMVTGTEIKVDNIRAGRPKPGLMRQHLACVNAAQAICNAEVSGAEVGSTTIIFKPQSVQAGEYEFSVGTAGSTTLIFQTVLPALARVKGESHLRFHGGTHNMYAPSFDFIALAFIPLLKQMGIEVELTLQRHGFYPQGCGEWSAIVRPPEKIAVLELIDAGALIKKSAVITSANIPSHIEKREMDEIASLCGWAQDDIEVKRVNAMGSGNIVSLRLHHQHYTEVVEQVGKIGLSAERVVRNAVDQLRRYQASRAVVGEHLADQLMLYMALAEGGCMTALKPTRHTKTNRDVIHLFTERRFKFTELARDLWEILI